MDRRTLVSMLAGILALSGRLGDDLEDNDSDTESSPSENNSEDTEPVRDHFDGDPERPECTKESETVEIEHNDGETTEYETEATISYPDTPSEFTTDTLVEYAEAFERAYITHDALCDKDEDAHALKVENSIEERETFDWYDDITVIYLERFAGVSHGIDEEGDEWQAEIDVSVACYAIDETGVARVQTDYLSPEDYESDGPNPLDEGTLVVVFE